MTTWVCAHKKPCDFVYESPVALSEPPTHLCPNNGSKATKTKSATVKEVRMPKAKQEADAPA